MTKSGLQAFRALHYIFHCRQRHLWAWFQVSAARPQMHMARPAMKWWMKGCLYACNFLCDCVGIRQGIVTSRQWISGIFCQCTMRYIQMCAKGAVGEITWSEPQSRYAARDARPISATPFRDTWLALKAL